MKRKDLLGYGTSIASLVLDNYYIKVSLEDNASNIVLIPLVYQSRYPSKVIKNRSVDGLCKTIYDAIDIYKCKILCISSGIDADDDMLRKAIKYAENQGVIINAAVGNDNLNSPNKIFILLIMRQL